MKDPLPLKKNIPFTDSKKYAEAVNLVYVTDAEPGILRRKMQNGFLYLYMNKKVGSKAELERIEKLVIPPVNLHPDR